MSNSESAPLLSRNDLEAQDAAFARRLAEEELAEQRQREIAAFNARVSRKIEFISFFLIQNTIK